MTLTVGCVRVFAFEVGPALVLVSVGEDTLSNFDVSSLPLGVAGLFVFFVKLAAITA